MRTIAHSKPSLSSKDRVAVLNVLSKGQLTQAAEVASFEQQMAKYLNRKQGVAVSSGTAALHLALMGLGVDEGDEVMLPSYACSALLLAINYVGAKPVFLDTDPETFLLDPDEIKRKKTRKTKALILVHPFGYPLESSFYASLGIPVIEDIATSLGAQLGRKKIGSDGKITICSFYATKLMTTGEGGMLLSDSSVLAKKFQAWRSYDERSKWEVSFNYKMTDFQAALGKSQLKQFPLFLKKRKKIAQFYLNSLKEIDSVRLPDLLPRAQPAYHRFVFRHKKANGLINKLNQKGIQLRRPVFKPLHQYLNLKGFPGTELLHKQMVSIPIYPSLSQQDQKRVIQTIKTWVNQI